MAESSGLLDPNAPRNPDPIEKEIGPNEEEKQLAKQVNGLFEKYSKARKKYDYCWVDNYKLFRGFQWSNKRPSYKHREVINLIFQTIQSQASVMLDTRPQVGFLPMEPSDYELSDILNKVFQADWDRNNWLDEWTDIIFDSHIYSVGFGYTCFDEEALHNQGSIAFSAEDPMDFYPDPEASNVNKKARGFICAKPQDMEEVKRKYAGHKYVNLLKPDLEEMGYYKRTQETLHRKKVTDLELPVDSSSSMGAQEDAKDKVLVVTAYLKPNDTEQITEDDKDSEGGKVYITRLKYPRGRKIVKINDFIMEDEELPYDHMEFPYIRNRNYALPREFFGISEIDNTKGPQAIFNKLVNFSLDVLTLMGNPIWKVPVESGVNTRKLISQPGLIIEHNANFPPVREEGVQLQPYVLQMIDRMEKWFNDEAGTQDVTRGVNPTGVTANAAIENLLEAAQKRIKQKMRNLDSALKDFGRQWLSLCFQYYTAPRVYRITNNAGVNEYFKFHVEHRDTGEVDAAGKPRVAKFAIVRPYLQGQDGAYMPAEMTSEYQIKGEFDVRVNTVSGLAFSKSQNESQALNLFDRQIIDAEEVLTRLEYPNKEAILNRMREQQAQAAAAQPPPQQ